MSARTRSIIVWMPAAGLSGNLGVGCKQTRESENGHTYPTHCTGTVVPVDGRFTWVSHRSYITLPPQENGVY